ncbi:MAG: ribonuclease H-like domain-containing protein [Patescibacteria group bacterium]
MDKLVIDIETKNSFADVGGQYNVGKLEVSFVGVYSYNQDKYLSFAENEMDKLASLIQKAGLLIGFSMNRFDLPVLEKHCKFNIFALPRLDLLDEIELALGHRVSLDSLAKTNLGVGKTHSSGLEAIRLYNEGKLDELAAYCLNDVKITKELYDLAKKQGHLMVPQRNSDQPAKAQFNWKEEFLPATLF